MAIKFRRKVQAGLKIGQKIGFPTVNLHVGNFGQHVQQGVYICDVIIQNVCYTGLLHYGPKLSHHSQKLFLEIHIINFNRQIYGQFITFSVLKKIRAPKKFNTLVALKKQLKADLKHV